MRAIAQPEATYVASSLLHLLVRFLDIRQVSAPALRERVSSLSSDRHIPITEWWALLDEIQRTFPHERTVGLQVGACVQVHHTGVLGYLILHSDTLGQALLRFSRFQRLLHNLAPSVIHQSSDELVLGWTEARASTQLSDDVFASGLIAFSRQITGRSDVKATKVFSMHAAPIDASPYEQAFGCPVKFGCAESAMHLPGWATDLPINSQDPHLIGLLEQQAESLLRALPASDPWPAEVRRHLVVALQDGEPEATAVADRMGMSERAFYRALQDRGLRYKHMLNGLRQELAQAYLSDPLLSLPEIALLLGYAEQSVFSRAFKLWTGESPLRWRRKAVSLGGADG